MEIPTTGDLDGIKEIMVTSAFTSSATFRFLGDDGEESGEQSTLLETRIFTADGVEHHLLWPIEAALPLLASIMNVAIATIGGPMPESASVPDDLEPWETEFGGYNSE